MYKWNWKLERIDKGKSSKNITERKELNRLKFLIRNQKKKNVKIKLLLTDFKLIIYVFSAL